MDNKNKVLLYDSNDVKIGETFIRRARQLVKQQRGEWTDESQSAVKFFPDKVEGWEDVAIEDEALVALAERRIKERTRIIAHSIALVPVFILLLILSANFFFGSDVGVALGFSAGAWLTGYVIHLCQFILPRRNKMFNTEERKARRLATEIAILKNELQQ
ncbi:MAG: hypothetical protein FWE04_04805 [Oscillospiraceae bacterium]|nr:hypothetical protein [Oscillospiraceae bacterium]